jgi:polysaccharide export outer membrane protein
MMGSSFGRDLRRASPASVLVLAALVCTVGLAAPLAAQAPTPYFARTVDDSTRDPRPGEAFERSLRRSVTALSAEDRWRDLPQFGRSLFAPGGAGFTPPEGGTVGPDYVLGPGDQLLVFVSGFADTSYALPLDREGKVFLPRVGTTFLWGLSFAEAEQLVRARLASVLRNARIHVSMGRMRTIDVYVLGEAREPGRRSLSGLATAFHALVAAGGPNDRGSLRDIHVLRADREVGNFDLYPFMLHGERSSDVRLESGDVVFVGPVRPRAGIQGAVVRPGVYELDAPCSLRQLLALAGGTTPFADLKRVQIERVDAHDGFRVQDVPLADGAGPDSLRLSDFDLVTVLPLNERLRNVVTLDGYVRHAGAYELVAGMTLAALLTQERLQPEAALDHAQFSRVDSATFEVQARDFSPREVLEGRLDWPLQPLDAVTIFSSARMPKSVALDGEVLRPGIYGIAPGERLSSVLRRAGGPTPGGALRAAVFTRRSAAAAERQAEREFLQRVRIEGSGDSANADARARAQANLLLALEGGSHPGRVVVELDETGQWQDTARDPVLEDGDRLYLPARPTVVAVLGSVKNPGTMLARPGVKSGGYVSLAGGPARDSDLKRSYLIRVNGTALSYGAGLRVEPGDALVIVPREAGASSFVRSAAGSLDKAIGAALAVALVVMAARR